MNAVEKWHDIMKNPGSNISEKLDDLLDDNVIFYCYICVCCEMARI